MEPSAEDIKKIMVRYGCDYDIDKDLVLAMSNEFEEKELWYNKEFGDVHEKIKDKTQLTYCDYLRIRNYKLQLKTEVTEKDVEQATNESFNAKDIEGALRPLLELHGVGLPMASAILAMKDPKKFAIIDKNTLTTIKKFYKVDWITVKSKKAFIPSDSNKMVELVELYTRYLDFLATKSREWNLELLQIERAFFMIGQNTSINNQNENNGTTL